MGVFDKISSFMKIGVDTDDEYEDEYEEDDEDYAEPESFKREEVVKPVVKPEKKAVAPAPKRRIAMNDTSVCVFKPKSFEESKEIVETFLEDKTVVMNFEGVDVTISQRILDIVTGACIAVGGNLQKISNYIFIATPSSVDLTGECQDNLTGAFDTL